MPNQKEPLSLEELMQIRQAAIGYVIGGKAERCGAGPENTLRLVEEVLRLREIGGSIVVVKRGEV